jgi:hypothetical protein
MEAYIDIFFKNKWTVTGQDLLRGFFPSHVIAVKSVANLKYFRVYFYKSLNLPHKKSHTMSCGIITLLALIQDSDFYRIGWITWSKLLELC